MSVEPEDNVALPVAVERTHQFADGEWVPDVPYPEPPVEPTVKHYNPEQVKFSFNGVECVGFADGPFEYDAESDEVTFVSTPTTRGRVEFTLLAESPTNHLLEELIANHPKERLTVMVFEGAEIIGYTPTPPPPGTRQWVFDNATIRRFAGPWVKPLTGRQRTRRLWRRRGRR